MSKNDLLKNRRKKVKDSGKALNNANTEEYRGKDIAGRILIGLSIVLVLIAVLVKGGILRWNTSLLAARSVSIIGGADGPTSVFIAGKVGEPIGLYAVAATVITITIIYKLYRHYSK